MKDINYFVLKSGTIIRKDILAIRALCEDDATYVVTFAETPQVIYINQTDYLELKEILC